MRCLVLDIDGVLAETGARRLLLQQDPPAWEEFFRGCMADQITPLANLLRHLYETSDFIFILLSSRPEWNRKDTEQWLIKHRIPYDLLYLRADGEQTGWKVDKIKEIMKSHDVLAIFEDDPKYIRRYRELGWPIVPIWSPFHEGNPV